MINIENIRHPKEKTYFTIMMVISILIYLAIAVPLITSIIISLPVILLLAFFSWWASQKFKADIFGNSVHVNPNQYGDIYQMAWQQSQQLGVPLPEIFITNSNGYINAFAAKLFLSKYIILNSSLVDLMLSADASKKELESIIGHELGHHAAGHLSTKKKLLIAPAKMVPFIGPAYSRACELTCDRVGYVISGDLKASQRGLFALALGSCKLVSTGNMEAFVAQERDIPEIAAFFNKLAASHPRTTLRIKELELYAQYSGGASFASGSSAGMTYDTGNAAKTQNESGGGTIFCSECGAQNISRDTFCSKCGSALIK